MSKKQFAQTAPEVQHAQYAINFVLQTLPYLAFYPDNPADVQLYDKYSLQIYHKLSVLKRSVMKSSGELRYNLLKVPHYVDALAYCLLLPSKAAQLSLEILRLHCLDSYLLDHALLIHENLMRGVRHAFSSYKEAYGACVFLVRDLTVSPYNYKILLYDENAIFVLHNAFFAEENELLPLIKKAAMEAIERLSQVDVLVGYLVFEDVLLDYLEQTQIQEEIEAILGVLKTFYAEDLFEDDKKKLSRAAGIVYAYESDICDDFVAFANEYLYSRPDSPSSIENSGPRDDVREQAIREEAAVE